MSWVWTNFYRQFSRQPPKHRKRTVFGFARLSGGVALLIAGCTPVSQSLYGLADNPLISRRAQTPEVKKETNRPTRYNAKVELLLNRSMDQYRLGQLKEAQASLRAVRKVDPYYINALEFEARIAMDLGDIEGQIVALNSVIAANPGSAHHQNWAGKLMVSAGKVEIGLNALRRATELSPRTVRYAQDLAAVYSDQGDGALAAKVLEESLQRNPTNESLAVSLARLYESEGEWSQAAFYYEFALRFDPKNLLYRRHLARSLYHAGEYQRAYEMFGKYTDLNDPEIAISEYVEYGDVCLRLEDYERAQLIFDKLSQEMLQQSSEVEILRGLCALHRGEKDLATEILSAALALEADDEIQGQVLALCETLGSK